MDSNVSPSLVNLYMGWWEETFLFSQGNPFGEYIDWFCRFIDDLIFVWKGPFHALDPFVGYLNANHLNLEFTPAGIKLLSSLYDMGFASR